MIFIYVTASTQEEAETLSRGLLERHLIACANIWPMQSMYFWEGEMKKEAEIAMILKTSSEKFHAVEHFILENHSYDNPCVALIDISRATPEFKNWVLGSVA